MIWKWIDLYGQLLVWIASLLPLWYMAPALQYEYWAVPLLMHAVGLMVLGIWQATGCVAHKVHHGATASPIFAKHLLKWGVVVVLVLIALMMDKLNSLPNLSRGTRKGILVGCLVLVNLLCIQYWIHLRKYYRYGKEKNAGSGGISQSGQV